MGGFSSLLSVSSYVYVIGKLVLMYVGVIFFYTVLRPKNTYWQRALLSQSRGNRYTYLYPRSFFTLFYLWRVDDKRPPFIIGIATWKLYCVGPEKIGKNADFIAHIFAGPPYKL